MNSLYQDYLNKSGEFGTIEEVSHPMVFASGLPRAKRDELVISESGNLGQVIALSQTRVEIVTFENTPLRVGEKITRTGENISVPVDMTLLGRNINPLGYLPNNTLFPGREKRSLFSPLLSITKRAWIKKPFLTGVSLVDTMIPLGSGQRELIVGDRKTGKTAFLLSTLKTQAQLGTIIVYASIGKTRSETKKLELYFQQNQIQDRCVIVSTSPSDSPSLINLTPFTAMTVAEYFRDAGNNVLVIFDDLTTHAKFYREVSLLGKKFPGRDSYPGDIFFVHANLLEHGGNYKIDDNEVSITCLPVAETSTGELTDFIVSNLISITDGHILFDSTQFSKGRRPAVNIPLSVTRVGKQTQDQIRRELNNQLTTLINRYTRSVEFSHFGAELSEEIKKLIHKGDLLYAFFNQDYHQSVPLEIQVVLCSMILSDLLESETDFKIQTIRDSLVKKSQTPQTKNLLREITSASNSADLSQNINAHLSHLLQS